MCPENRNLKNQRLEFPQSCYPCCSLIFNVLNTPKYMLVEHTVGWIGMI